MLLQHARNPARFAVSGDIVLLEEQDRTLWNSRMIAEGLALVDKALAGSPTLAAALCDSHSSKDVV